MARYCQYDRKGDCRYCGLRIDEKHPARLCESVPEQKTPQRASQKDRPQPRSHAEQLRILKVCGACEQCTNQANPAQAACREVIRRGKAKGIQRAGRLMHPRGIPSPNSVCPLGRW